MGDFVTKIAALALAPATGGFSLSGFLLSTAASFALSAVARALAPKPKASSVGSSSLDAGITQNVRQAITSHKIIYGQTRVGGPYIYLGATGNNEYMHFIVALAAHKVSSIDEVWFNDTVIPIDALDTDGNVTTGRYAGVARIRKHLGDDGQVADALMLAELSDWSTAHRLRGIAYLYIRLQYNQDLFPSGIPNFSAVVRGKEVYDPRTGTSYWSPNTILHQRDYLSSADYGFGAVDAEIDDVSVAASANIADEMVPVTADEVAITSVNITLDTLVLQAERLKYLLGDRVQLNTTGTAPDGLAVGVDYYVVPYQLKDVVQVRLATTLANAVAGSFINLTSIGTGTHKIIKFAEPRYHGMAFIDTETDIGENLKDLLSGSGGKAICAGGLWKLLSASWRSATISFNEHDFIGPINVQTRLARRERFNAIKGVYTSPMNDFQASDYPVLTDAAAVTRDGETVYFDYPLPCTNRVTTVQRLIKIELKKSRQEIVVKALLNLKALQVQAGDNVMLNVARFGWVNKLFEVTVFRFTNGGNGNNDEPQISIELTLRETDSSIFDWSSSEESTIDYAPNTNLPNPFLVQIITGVMLQSVAVPTQAADNTYKIVCSFDAHPDFYVQNGGIIEVQFKDSADSVWKDSYPLDGRTISGEIFQATLGTSYDVRLRARNNLQVRSSWTAPITFVVGATGGLSASYDYGLVSEAFTTSEDFGLVSATVTLTDDYGAVI